MDVPRDEIVTQLRSYQHAKNIRGETRQMAQRAADEIERLRDENLWIRNQTGPEIERLRAALKPFVKARQSIEVGDLSGALSVITVGDLRRASAAFGDEQKADR